MVWVDIELLMLLNLLVSATGVQADHSPGQIKAEILTNVVDRSLVLLTSHVHY